MGQGADRPRARGLARRLPHCYSALIVHSRLPSTPESLHDRTPRRSENRWRDGAGLMSNFRRRSRRGRKSVMCCSTSMARCRSCAKVGPMSCCGSSCNGFREWPGESEAELRPAPDGRHHAADRQADDRSDGASRRADPPTPRRAARSAVVQARISAQIRQARRWTQNRTEERADSDRLAADSSVAATAWIICTASDCGFTWPAAPTTRPSRSKPSCSISLAISARISTALTTTRCDSPNRW